MCKTCGFSVQSYNLLVLITAVSESSSVGHSNERHVSKSNTMVLSDLCEDWVRDGIIAVPGMDFGKSGVIYL